MIEGVEDTILSTRTKNGLFFVKGAKTTHLFSLKVYLEELCSTKGVFCYLVGCWSKILTLDQLQKRGMAIVNRCSLCQESKETENQLLHCLRTKVLLELHYYLFGISRMMPTFIQGFVLGWRGSFLSKDKQRV